MPYQGHHPDGSSIQRHSAGATYPYVVVATNGGAHVQAPNGEIVFRAPFSADTRPARIAAYGACLDEAEARALGYESHAARIAADLKLWQP